MKRSSQLAAACLLSLTATHCTFAVKMLGGMGGGEGAAYTVNMADYDVESIAFDFDKDSATTWCPGASGNFVISAQARNVKKKKATETLVTRLEHESAAKSRGKMDFLDFSLGAAGGEITRGSFRADADPFNTLMGMDVQATYRRDATKKAQVHFTPEYSCIRSTGGSGATGNEGQRGQDGAFGGGNGGRGGPGGAGAPGPQLTAYVSVVQTPLYDAVGIARVTGDRETLTLFDLATGITISAAGGSGGRGGDGGDGGQGADGAGQGGQGGVGGAGGPGGDGGVALVVLDHRFEALRDVVKVSVAGGSAGSGGRGGAGGYGGEAPETCADCESADPGPDGPAGTDGLRGEFGGRDGRKEIRTDNVDAAFATLPPGVALRKDPHPETRAPKSAPNRGKGKPNKGKHHRRRKGRR